MESSTAQALPLEEVMEMIPVGYFHYRLLLMCGLTFMTDALEITLLSFVTACAGAEWNLTNAQKATLTAVVFSGIMLGSIFWGRAADKWGRRPAYLYCCILISVGGILSAFATSYVMLLLLRALVGFGIGGASVPFDLLAEFSPSSMRGQFLVSTMLFWTFGSMFVAGLAWATLSTLGWRFVTFVCALPVLSVSLFSYMYLPESPRWLLTKHKEQEANKTIRDAATVNGSHLPEFVLDDDFSKHGREGSYADLLNTAAARETTLPLWLIWGLFGFTYYAVVLFISRVYSNQSNHQDNNTEHGVHECQFDYPPIFYSAASETAAVLLSGALIDKLGRVWSQTLFYATGGVAVVLLSCDLPPGAVLFFSILARMCAMSSSVATWVATPELFATELRATGHSSCTAVSKLCSFFAPYLVSSALAPVSIGVVLGVLNLLAAGTAQLLPETTQGGLAETRSGECTTSAVDAEQCATLETEMAPLHQHSLHALHHTNGRQSITTNRSAGDGRGGAAGGHTLYSALPMGSSHGTTAAAVPNSAHTTRSNSSTHDRNGAVQSGHHAYVRNSSDAGLEVAEVRDGHS